MYFKTSTFPVMASPRYLYEYTEWGLIMKKVVRRLWNKNVNPIKLSMGNWHVVMVWANKDNM
jgi:hypothetical protein